MSQLKTYRGGFERMRARDVTTADTAVSSATTGATHSIGDKPSNAKKVGGEYNGVQVIFSGGWDMVVSGCSGSAIADLDNEEGCSFEMYGWPANGPAMKICDGSIKLGNVRLDSTTVGMDATQGAYCASISLDDEPHPTSISVNNVDSTNGIANLTFDTLGYEYIAIQYLDVSFPVSAWIRPY